MSAHSPRQQEHHIFPPSPSEHLSEYLLEEQTTTISQTRPLLHSTERVLPEPQARRSPHSPQRQQPERQRPYSCGRREQGLHLDKRSLCRSIGNGFRRNNKPPCLLHRRKHRQLRKFLHHRRSKRLNHIPDIKRRNPYCDNRNIIYFHPHPRHTSRSIFWRNKQQQFLKLGPCCLRRNAPYRNLKPVALHIQRNVNNRNVKCCRSPYHRKSSRCRNNNDSVLEQLASASRGNASHPDPF